eukprot:scaffold843_cov330-Pavlova_lutheri.AAC.35
MDGQPSMGGVLNSSPRHLVIKLILTAKVEPSPNRLLDLRGIFLRISGVREQGASLLTVKNVAPYPVSIKPPKHFIMAFEARRGDGQLASPTCDGDLTSCTFT